MSDTRAAQRLASIEAFEADAERLLRDDLHPSLPAVVHEVPVRAIERWKQSPTVSPKDYLRKLVNQRSK